MVAFGVGNHVAQQWEKAGLARLEQVTTKARLDTHTHTHQCLTNSVEQQVAHGPLGRSAGGCTLFQLVLSVWAVLLCRHAGQEEVVVGSPYHGRDAAGTEALIGYFVNVLALRVETWSSTTMSQGRSQLSSSMPIFSVYAHRTCVGVGARLRGRCSVHPSVHRHRTWQQRAAG